MFEFDVIKKLIDNIDGLRPEGLKGDGCCFGTTVWVLQSLFAGNLEECQKTITLIINEFSGLSDDNIKRHILKLEDDADKRQFLALVANIALAQQPSLYQNKYLENNLALNAQHTSIQSMLEFFECGAPKTIRKGKVLNGFSTWGTHSKLRKFFSNIGQVQPKAPVGFVVSYIGHTVGCGYDNKNNAWVLTDINHNKIFRRFATTDDLADNLWKAIGTSSNTGRAIYIHPIVPDNNICYNHVILNFQRDELNALDKPEMYLEQEKLKLYINAYNFNDHEMQHKMHKRKLIKKNANFWENVDTISQNDKYVLTTAIRTGQDDIALGCIWHGDAPMRDNPDGQGETPLICAIRWRNTYYAKKLLTQQNVNAVDKHGTSALYYAVENENDELVELLIKYGAFVNAKADGGWTPLHRAACRGNSKIATALINNNADINIQTKNGYTALHLAACNGYENVAWLLCKNNNINTKLVTIHNETAYDLAIRHYYPSIVTAINNTQEGLINDLLIAMREKNWDKASRILQYDEVKIRSNINQRDSTGWTALHYAIYENNSFFIDRLIHLGTDINVINDFGKKRDQVVAFYGNSAFASLLVPPSVTIVREINMNGMKRIHRQ